MLNISMLPSLRSVMRKKMNISLILELSRLKITLWQQAKKPRAIMGQRRTKSMPNRKLKPLHFLMKEELLEKILHVIESQLIQIYYMEGTLTMKLLP